VNPINERLRVIDIAPSKTPETLRDRYIKDLSLIRLRTGLDLEKIHCLRQRSIPNVLVILLEVDFSSEVQGTEDLTTHRSLRSDRPCLNLAVHSSSDSSRVIATKILIPILVLVLHSTPDGLRVISVS
jgi:hypothetical protein